MLKLALLPGVLELLIFSAFLPSAGSISLQDAYQIRQKVKTELSRPRILGPGQAPLIAFDRVTGEFQVLQRRPTLQEILEKARENLKREKELAASFDAEGSDRLPSSIQPSPVIPRFARLRQQPIDWSFDDGKK